MSTDAHPPQTSQLSSQPPSQPSSQWQRLLKNVGTWQGSFTQLSAQGDVLSDTPTEVALIPQDDGKAMHQEVRRYTNRDYSDEPNVQAFDYRTLNRTTLFFEDGAFSQGSAQWGPFSKFGAELGLIAGDRRLRVVQLFETDSTLSQITLIREQLKGTDAPERAALKISDLIGTWQGEATTQYADLRPEQSQSTQLTIEALSSHQIRQTLTFGTGYPPISSTGTVEGSKITFTQGQQPIQVLLLPDGSSVTGPVKITPREPLFLEAGWLLNATTRQRIIRRYDASGAWSTLTLVTETKV
ncbi:MAG: DUF3598 family protein [Cyanobacteria bacterium J06598_3]